MISFPAKTLISHLSVHMSFNSANHRLANLCAMLPATTVNMLEDQRINEGDEEQFHISGITAARNEIE